MLIRRSPNGAGHTRPQPGRDRSEQVVAINRNAWSQSIGTGGRNHPVRAAWVWLHNRTPEFRAWQRHSEATEGRDTPTDNRGGWLFPSKLPPLEAEAPPKGQAL
jgi:hypothetical protein